MKKQRKTKKWKVINDKIDKFKAIKLKDIHSQLNEGIYDIFNIDKEYKKNTG